MNLSLRQGDITEEKVDAIVNPTNSQLDHGGKAGVAAAMVRKGGRQIVDDSWYVMSQRRAPLQVGEAVYTLSGNLPCQNVIHTVGPDWRVNGEASVPLLRRACLESLRLGVRLKLCSIALPAISSGSFGMPKDICAQAIFKAVEEYSSSIDAECSNLRDIRIVIIDHPTIEVFCQEFAKRYCSNDSYSLIDQERASASAANSTEYLQSAKGIPPDNQEKNVGNKSPNAEVDKRKSGDGSEQMGTQVIKSSNLHTKSREQSARLPSENGEKTDKTTLPYSVEEPLDESGKLSIRKEKNAVSDQSSGKTTKSSVIKVTVVRNSFEPTFPRNRNGHSTKRIATAGGMTSKQIKTSPGVAVAVANRGSNPDEHPMEPGSQRADAANLVTHREEKEAKSVSSTNANQPVAEPNGVDKGTLKLNYLTETADEDKSSVNSPLNKDQADEITYLHKRKETDAPDNDDDDSGESNGGNVPDSQANPSKASETKTPTSRSYTPTEGSTADIPTVKTFNQVPLDKISNQTDPDNSATEPTTTEGIPRPKSLSHFYISYIIMNFQNQW